MDTQRLNTFVRRTVFLPFHVRTSAFLGLSVLSLITNIEIYVGHCPLTIFLINF